MYSLNHLAEGHKISYVPINSLMMELFEVGYCGLVPTYLGSFPENLYNFWTQQLEFRYFFP